MIVVEMDNGEYDPKLHAIDDSPIEIHTYFYYAITLIARDKSLSEEKRVIPRTKGKK
jgi:hypothetical protein